MDEESSFRGSLHEAADWAIKLGPAAMRSWARWNERRFVFADWLEDHGRYLEAALTRADWRPKFVRHGNLWQTKWGFWYVVMPDDYVVRPSAQRLLSKSRLSVNAQPLLHFSSGTLRLKGFGKAIIDKESSIIYAGEGEKCLRFTWSANRGKGGYRFCLDTSLHPDGYFSLFSVAKKAENSKGERLPLLDLMEAP